MTKPHNAAAQHPPHPPAAIQRRSAWDLWRTHTGEVGPMSHVDEKPAMIERHGLVVSLIDVNSRQLRCDSARAGLEIERACAQRDAGMPERAAAAAQQLVEVERRMAALAEDQRKLARERDFLDTALAELDAAAPAAVDRVGRG